MRAQRIVRQGLWQQVASRLRREIAKGRLAPGTRLIEAELAERYGVSRGPVREALRDLARSGLVVGIPNRGFFVCTPSDADLEEIFVLREALEQAAARLAATRMSPEDAERLRGLLVALDAARAAGDSAARKASDLRFHREIFLISGSSRLLRAHDDLAAEMLLANASGQPSWNDDVYPPAELHGHILDALTVGGDAKLFEAIQAHYAWTDDRLFGRSADGRGVTEAIAALPATRRDLARNGPEATSGAGPAVVAAAGRDGRTG